MVVSTLLFDLSLNATFSERLSSDTRPEACLCPSCPFLVLFVWKATDLGQPDRILGLPLHSGVSLGTCLTSPKAVSSSLQWGYIAQPGLLLLGVLRGLMNTAFWNGSMCFEGGTMVL